MQPHSLENIISLERIYEGLYRGNSYEIGSLNVFGGHVLGQALYAARMSVDPERKLHSMHSYFILAGDKSKPLFYHVENVRDGGSFNTRRVRCSQEGKDIFILSASYQKVEEGLSHQSTAPQTININEMVNMDDLKRMFLETQPAEMQKYLQEEWPIDIRIRIDDLSMPNIVKEPIRKVWMKVKQPLTNDQEFHKCVLAYASDFNLLTTALMPHGIMIPSKGLMMASLDHAMWFHREINFNDWLLYDIQSPAAHGGRGLCFGHIYDRAGILVASVAQEGLVRYKPNL